MKCYYCARFGREGRLEYLPNKKAYHCSLCDYYFGEDDINARVKAETRAGGFPLTVVKEDVAEQVKEIYKTSVVDDEKEMLKATKNDEDQTYTADDKKKRFIKKK